jgi:hypothetical protein
MNKILWTLQIVLAAIFGFAAGLKLFAFDMMAAKSPGTSHLHPLFVFIAICEIAGAAALILPGWSGRAPFLTSWAAVGLATISLLAALFHLQRGEYGELVMAIVLFLVAAFVARKRWIAR